GLMFSSRTSGFVSSQLTWISLSKWPMLQRIASSFMTFMWSPRMTSMQPVAVTKMSPTGAASSIVTTSYPSMAACSAQMGSISVMSTRAPRPRAACEQPLPTSPYPATTTTLPATMTSVARLMPSNSDSRQPYLLSNFDFVTESLTLMHGNNNDPAFCMS